MIEIQQSLATVKREPRARGSAYREVAAGSSHLSGLDEAEEAGLVRRDPIDEAERLRRAWSSATGAPA
jgi:hypothetical protein